MQMFGRTIWTWTQADNGMKIVLSMSLEIMNPGLSCLSEKARSSPNTITLPTWLCPTDPVQWPVERSSLLFLGLSVLRHYKASTVNAGYTESTVICGLYLNFAGQANASTATFYYHSYEQPSGQYHFPRRTTIVEKNLEDHTCNFVVGSGLLLEQVQNV